MSLHPPILAPDAPPKALAYALESVRARLMALDEHAYAEAFGLGPAARLLKTTISLCPDCLRHVGAAVYANRGRVLMRKRCPTHGLSEALIESDESFYRLSNKDRWGRRFNTDRVADFPAYDNGCCGDAGDCCDTSGTAGAEVTDQWSNKTCTVLVEVTNACNLACPVCYSDAKGDRKMPLETFKAYILEMVRRKGGLDSVQLTGGEAVLHPQFWEMAAFLHGMPGVEGV